MEGTVSDHTSLDIILSAILDFGHYQKSQKNINCNSQSQHRELQPKPIPTKFRSIFNFSMMAAILDFSPYLQNCNYNSQNQYRDLQPKPNQTKFGSIFKFNMMSSIMDFSHYQKSQKTAIKPHRTNIETYNQN